MEFSIEYRDHEAGERVLVETDDLGEAASVMAMIFSDSDRFELVADAETAR